MEQPRNPAHNDVDQPLAQSDQTAGGAQQTAESRPADATTLLQDQPEPDHSAPPADTQNSTTAGNPRRVAVVLIFFLLLVLVLHVAMNRLTPYTSEAVVQSVVLPVAPNVSGPVLEVAVRDNQPVTAGELLFRIDPAPYQASLAQAEAELDNAKQQIGAAGTGLGAADAAVVSAQAHLIDVQQRHQRIEELRGRGFATQSDLDDSQAAVSQAKAGLASAKAQLAEAQQRVGPSGLENPQVRSALAAREQAQLNLRYTTVNAPIDGHVTNTVLVEGQYAAAGARAVTLVDNRSAWIVAHLPENALGNVAPGDLVEIVLDVQPGVILTGRVDSIASGVASDMSPDLQSVLSRPDKRGVWVRGAERIPVHIELDDAAQVAMTRHGALASVTVHTQKAGLMAPVARWWMRLVAMMRYAW